MHPSQFQVNEAWIIFKLNEAPIRTADAGSFNCICLMDAASCFILGNALVPVNESETFQIRQLLRTGWQHRHEFPTRLFVPVGQFQTSVPEEAEAQGIEVVRVPEGQLMVFIRDAREAFKEYTNQGGSTRLHQFPNSDTFDFRLN